VGIAVWLCSRLLLAMFCPQCRAEYRSGFTRCADCGVELVEEVVEEGPSGALATRGAEDARELEEDPFCLFWKGDDARIYAELCELLGNEDIPCKTFRRADTLFNISAKTSFEIGIPYSQFEKAEALVKEAYEMGDEGETRDGKDIPALPGTVDPPK